ncbi:MAG: hypothetical protein PHR83_07995 [Paludibacter sp.]|nr:hypothetical protein [Paludibacter sp.]
MEKVIMSIDKTAISEKIELCKKAAEDLQNLYNGFNEIGVKPTISQMFSLVSANRQSSGLEYKIKDLIVDNTEMQTVNSLTMNRSKLIDMLDTPQNIVELVKECGTEPQLQRSDIGMYLQLTDGVINTVDGYENIIAEKFTLYAQNQKQADMFKFLDGMLDGLNKYFLTVEPGFPDLRGYKFEGQTIGYSVDLGYISRF